MMSPAVVIPQIQVTLNCNSACSYCFQKHHGKIIEISTVKAILEKTVSVYKIFFNNNPIEIYWHGGEPLLAGIEFFQNIIEIESSFPETVFENRIQTNGTLMTEEFAGFFAKHNFGVGFSIDGPEYIHNLHRRFRDSLKGTFADAIRGINLYKQYANAERIPVIAVITRASINRVHDLYEFFKDIGAEVGLDIYDIRSADFYADSSHIFELAPSSEEVARFLIEMFDLWFYDSSRRVSFKELRNEVKIILQPEFKAGSPFHKKRCHLDRTIFSWDGNAYFCDYYVNDDKTALGNIKTDSMEDIIARRESLWKEIKQHIRKSEKNMACASCEWGCQCIGGCLTCMKYNAMLIDARAKGLPDNRWYEGELPLPLQKISGETYYCEGLKKFRNHVKKAVTAELEISL